MRNFLQLSLDPNPETVSVMRMRDTQQWEGDVWLTWHHVCSGKNGGVVRGEIDVICQTSHVYCYG